MVRKKASVSYVAGKSTNEHKLSEGNYGSKNDLLQYVSLHGAPLP